MPFGIPAPDLLARSTSPLLHIWDLLRTPAIYVLSLIQRDGLMELWQSIYSTLERGLPTCRWVLLSLNSDASGCPTSLAAGTDMQPSV